jgi:hypothetical protein
LRRSDKLGNNDNKYQQQQQQQQQTSGKQEILSVHSRVYVTTCCHVQHSWFTFKQMCQNSSFPFAQNTRSRRVWLARRSQNSNIALHTDESH